MSDDPDLSPVIIGHRGFKASLPENSMKGFKGCFASGAVGIETDIHKTLDDVLVISHDNSTERCFHYSDGRPADKYINQSYFHEIKDLVINGTNERLMTLNDLLTWFHEYNENTGSNAHKLHLDIKKENPVKVMKLIIKDLLHVKDSIGYWLHRIQFGIWNLNVLKYLNQDDYFQKIFHEDTKNVLNYKQFDIFHISLDWRDSIHFINYNLYLDRLPNDGKFRSKLTGVSLLYLSTWSTDFLTKFVPLLRMQNLKFYSWTVNNKLQYEYVAQIGSAAELTEYGVITDAPDYMQSLKTGQDEDSGSEDLEAGLKTMTTSEDFSDKNGTILVHLTLKQRVLNAILEFITHWTGKPSITSDERVFNSFVDEDEIPDIGKVTLAKWLFQKGQLLGLF